MQSIQRNEGGPHRGRCVPSLGDMARLAQTVSALSAGEPQLAQAALACAILNRCRSDRAGVGGLAALCDRLFADGVADAGRARPEAPAFADPDFARALAIVCLVWAGDQDDPTNGATRFHRHDELPDWARAREPLALIGSRFFY